MKKVMCAKCGGSTKTKMAKGGAMKTTVGKATPKGQIYGIPQTGPTGPNYQGVDTMKKGGAIKKKYQMGGSKIGDKIRGAADKIRGAVKKAPAADAMYTNTTPGQVMMPPMKKGGMVKKYQKGGGIDDPKDPKKVSAIQSPAKTLGSMSGKDYRTLKKGVKREQKLVRLESGKQGERVDNVIRAVASGADAASATLRAAQSAKELMKNKKGGTIKKYQDGGTTKTRTGRDGKTITRSKSFDTEPKIGYSMKERSVSDKEGNLLKSKTKTTFTGTPAGTNRRTVVSKWNLKKDPESEGKSRKGIIPVRAKKK